MIWVPITCYWIEGSKPSLSYLLSVWLWLVTQTLCTSVSSFVTRGWNSQHLLTRYLWGLNKVIYIKQLQQSLDHTTSCKRMNCHFYSLKIAHFEYFLSSGAMLRKLQALPYRILITALKEFSRTPTLQIRRLSFGEICNISMATLDSNLSDSKSQAFNRYVIFLQSSKPWGYLVDDISHISS